MCGIVGYIGSQNAQKFVIDGLEKLEYRGYDSAGIAVNTGNNKISIVKKEGRLQNLADELEKNPLEGVVAIGHTRWATHGKPSDENSHPHFNKDKTLVVVHNGIIENYLELKKELLKKGYEFTSETDTEVVVHLLNELYDGDLLKATKKLLKMIRGAYALGIMSASEPDRMIAVRKESPLIIGLGKNENFIASDIPAILAHTRNVYFIDNGEVVDLGVDYVRVYDFEGNTVSKEIHKIEWSMDAASKAGYDHFMLKEIFEQPEAVDATLARRIDDEGRLRLDSVDLSAEELAGIQQIFMVACGTAFNAARVGRVAIERLTQIPVHTEIASEFRYSEPRVDSHTLMIFVSQSGETADTLAALRYAKSKGAKILSITNVLGSSLARESDYALYTWAGPEVAVASTKAYTTQILALVMLALDIAMKMERISGADYQEVLEEMGRLPKKINSILDHVASAKEIGELIKDKISCFYIGRGADYQTAQEGALKLKEISYIYTEAFAAGELKHGTIALIEEGTPVIALATQDYLRNKMISNILEVKARGAQVYAITTEGDEELEKVANQVIYIPHTLDILQGILAVIPTQLIAYYTSVAKNLDVDKPRNLAKSVTVE